MKMKDAPMTAKEAGAFFGVSASAMYKRAKKGTAPGHQLGRKVFFLRSEIVYLSMTQYHL